MLYSHLWKRCGAIVLLTLSLFTLVGCSEPPIAVSDVEFYDVTFAQNRFIAVGGQRIADPGTYQAFLLTSSDGKSWQPLTSPLETPKASQELLSGHILRGVAHGNGTFVAVGGSYNSWTSSLLLTSSDGQTWNVVEQDLKSRLVDVAYGNGKFVAVSEERQAWTSTDGQTWTSKDLDFQGGITGITYGNNTFVVYGSGSSLALSNDLSTWTPHTLEKVTQSSVSFANNQFLGSAIQNTCQGTGTCQAYSLLRSDQGKQWSLMHTSEQPRSIRGFAFNNGTYVVVQPGQLWTTPTLNDPTTWKSKSQAWREFRGLAFGNNTFVAVGYGEIQWSNDGKTWETKTYPRATEE